MLLFSPNDLNLFHVHQHFVLFPTIEWQLVDMSEVMPSHTLVDIPRELGTICKESYVVVFGDINKVINIDDEKKWVQNIILRDDHYWFG